MMLEKTGGVVSTFSFSEIVWDGSASLVSKRDNVVLVHLQARRAGVRVGVPQADAYHESEDAACRGSLLKRRGENPSGRPGT